MSNKMLKKVAIKKPKALKKKKSLILIVTFKKQNKTKNVIHFERFY